jgi:hypothetical protein
MLFLAPHCERAQGAICYVTMKKKTLAPSKAASNPKILLELENTLSRAVHNALERWPRLALFAHPGSGIDHIDSRATEPASSANARLAPSHEEIAIRAELLWREMGCPQGCDKQIWLAAERRLCRELRLEKEEKDRKALLEQLSLINHVRMDNMMEKLEELYPGATGISTTSL